MNRVRNLGATVVTLLCLTPSADPMLVPGITQTADTDEGWPATIERWKANRLGCGNRTELR
jgi:hypothetical protein